MYATAISRLINCIQYAAPALLQSVFRRTLRRSSSQSTRRWHVTISCQPDGRPPQPVRPWKSRTRSQTNTTFFIFWSRHENLMILHWDMAIYRFSKWRQSAILELFYHHTRPPTKSLLLAAASCQISRQSDIQIWRYSYSNFSYIWLEMPIQVPKMGVLGDFEPLNVTIHHRDPQKAHPSLRISASFKLSSVKIRWGVWPVGELTESVTDTHTHTYTHTFCPCIA